MGVYIYSQHEAARPYCTDMFQIAFPPLLSICKSSSQRGEFEIICSMNASTPRQAGRAQNTEKSTFTEPKWLLLAEDKARKDAMYVTSSTKEFQVVLTTSKDYGSGISDLNAGILLALIGEHGRCFVHRISTLVYTETGKSSELAQELFADMPTRYRFQRGSQDVVSFSGPDLGKLEAVWIAPEKGTWRIEDMTIRVFTQQVEKDSGNIIEDTHLKVVQYDFVCEEVLIGENEKNPAAELKPSRIYEIPYDGYLRLDSKRMVNGLQIPLVQVRIDGMKEYEALKFSLLSYDALLVALGSAVAAAIGRIEVAEGYFVGGLLGFLYLFVLERAVDQLPAPSSSLLSVSNDKGSSVTDGIESARGKSVTGNDGDGVYTIDKDKDQLVGNGFRAPLTKLSGIFAVSVLIVKALNTSNNLEISKEMLLAGAAGFLMTKIATVLASNMPISLKQLNSSEGEV